MKMSEIRCFVCNEKIPQVRIEALKLLHSPLAEWCHVACSQVQKKKGIFMGEPGVSELKLVDQVYEQSVRGIFNNEESRED
jgi:hypothetical protein